MYCPNCGVSNPPGVEHCYECGKRLPVAPTSTRCPFCGADGQEYKLTCTKCGADLRDVGKVGPGAAAEPTSVPTLPVPPPVSGAPSVKTRHCPICGRPMGINATMCDYCGRPEPTYAESTYEDEVYFPETQKPTAAGIMIFAAGVLGIVQSLILMGFSFPFCCSGLFAIFGIIAIAGSFSAYNRRGMWFAVIGGIFGILSVGFVIGAILALIAIVLIAISQNEFSD